MKRIAFALTLILTASFASLALADDGPARVITGEPGVRYLLDGHNKAVKLGQYKFYSVESNAPGSTACLNPGCATATVVDAFATPNPAVVAAAAAQAAARQNAAAQTTATSTTASAATAPAGAAAQTAPKAAAAPAAPKPKSLPSTSTFPSDPGEPIN